MTKQRTEEKIITARINEHWGIDKSRSQDFNSQSQSAVNILSKEPEEP
eukprot:CAMPEP_0170530340 /NCGR_PEP_ID=MMETSP0209-20121228/45439_1 /TAXON_ID=665100 ORGANISM="Litonotus pictus, Strain P1" /NCGR_SAMPLE_ID=MMETSP0209 /ASSEMBLY_ACC=CAM_ASM_000301 /LENGTH=47 /DNA_ID= /DNA_START= /DNA_END= /DNA_ORIENTATION=